MLVYLLRMWRGLRHAALDHIHWTPFDDGHEITGWVNEPGHVAPAESATEREAREDTLHAIRDGHPSSPAFDPARHLHLVDRGGMPADDD